MSQHIAAAKQKKGIKAGILFLLLQLAFFIPGIAQQYPVQGTLAISSPYPAYLSDYANPSIDKLALSLTLTDLNISNKRIRLKLFIQKQSSTIAQSNESIIGEPAIILDGGVPQRFTSMELANYFKIENLQGINGDAYSQPLPEGIYNIGFEVYDYFTGNKLSDRINQMFWLMLSDPPLLNMPRNHENILDANPNNPQIVFQWTPRTTQVTNTEYEFTLSELWDDAGDPYQQFLAAIPKYQSTTSNTTLLYGLTEPPLLAGRTYAWRVRAKAKAGFEDIGLYRQNGYSEIFMFKYAGQCAAVQGVNIEVKGYDRMYITWQPNPNQSLYKVAYRKYTPSNNWEWHETETFNPFLNLFDLEANTDYEIKVGGVCNDGLVSYSTPQTVRTLQSGQLANINCGQAPVLNLANQALLQHLSANEVVMAGDFPITITRVEGGSGVYNGEGWVKVPWLADTKIKVKYTGIKVSTDYKLLDGYFETTYDPNGANIGDIDGLIDDLNGIFTGGTDVGHVITGSDTTKYQVDFDIPDPCTSCTFTSDGHGGGTITFGNGHALTVTELPTTIKDANGDIYQVGADGTPIRIGNAGGTGLIAAADKATIDLNKGRVDFAPAAGMVYAFDAWQQAYDNSTSWAKKYEKMNGGAYRVSAKAIAPGKPDKVLARITLIDNTLKADSIKFVNGKGTIYEKKKISETDYEITMTGGPADDAQEIYALYPQGATKPLNLGKLLVAGYAIQQRKVVLVPVNGALVNKDSIRNALNRIYNKVCVQLEVTLDANFEDNSWDADHDNKLKVDGSSIWSVLTNEMKALNNAYKSRRSINSSSAYLFILNQAATQTDVGTVLGDMPRSKQFGYLFINGASDANIANTAAHEVGHGVFRLKHVFEQDIHQGGIDPENVMDYPSGENLSKYQWDIIHDPGIVIGVFEDDASNLNVMTSSIPQDLADDSTFNFITVSGKKITLPSNCIANFNYGISSGTEYKMPISYLYGFKILEHGATVEYNSKFDANNKFLGFYSNSNVAYIDTRTSTNTKNTAILFVPEKDGIYYIKYNVQLAPYANNEQSLTYDQFPVIPYSNGNIIKRSGQIDYSKISGLIKSQNEDWTLQAEFLKKSLNFHNQKVEHLYLTKIVELRTAYRKIFEEFSDIDCFNNWDETLKKFNISGQAVPCNGVWEQTLRNEPNLMTLKTSDPVAFYKRFINDFIDYVNLQRALKEMFIDSLSLNTTQADANHYLSICSNAEIKSLSWPNRKLLLQVMARSSLENDEEENAVRLVKYLPDTDKNNLLDALVTVKDAGNNDLLIKRYIGQTFDDLNGQEFYEFVQVIHNYANEKYHYEKSPFALGKNRKENRYFSYDPSFWTNKPIIIDVKENGKIQFAFRHMLTTVVYEAIDVDPYASVTLHFQDDKATGQFTLTKGATYTTSGIMAYAIMASGIKSNWEIGGFVVLNTVLLTTGIGELNAAIAAGRTGGIILAGTDIALGVGSILVETKYKDKWMQTENGRAILRFWENANLIYAGTRISQALYSSAVAAKNSSIILRNSADDAEKAILNETEDQADNITNSVEHGNGEIVFVTTPTWNTQLDDILSSHEFTSIFGRLPRNTSNQISRYASTGAFKDEFISLYGQLNGTGVKPIENIVHDFDNLIRNHSMVTDVEKYVDEMMQSPSKFKGGAFGLDILSDIPPSLQGKNLTGFEASIDDLSDCRFDMKFSDGSNFIFVETKNYAVNSLGSINNSTTFYSQFKTYMGEINSMDDMQYFFRANAGVTETVLKTKFQTLISNKAEEIFSILKPSVRQELNLIGENGRSEFNTLISNSNSDLYKFIKVK